MDPFDDKSKQDMNVKDTETETNLDGQASANEPDLYEQEYKSEPNMPNNKKKLIIGIAAAVLLCALGVAVPLLLNSIQPKTITVTVFGSDWSETALVAGEEIPLNEYLATESSVPGFPIRIGYPETAEIQISVDAGTILTWNAPDYVAKDRGTAWKISPGETVYWSPVGTDGKSVPSCTLTIAVISNGTEADAAQLQIREMADARYGATLSENP